MLTAGSKKVEIVSSSIRLGGGQGPSELWKSGSEAADPKAKGKISAKGSAPAKRITTASLAEQLAVISEACRRSPPS